MRERKLLLDKELPCTLTVKCPRFEAVADKGMHQVRRMAGWLQGQFCVGFQVMGEWAVHQKARKCGHELKMRLSSAEIMLTGRWKWHEPKGIYRMTQGGRVEDEKRAGYPRLQKPGFFNSASGSGGEMNIQQ